MGTKPQNTAKAGEPTRANIPSVEHLQPAPIPPTNPWNRKGVVHSNDENFPPLQPASKSPSATQEHQSLTRRITNPVNDSQETPGTPRKPSDCSSPTRLRSSTVTGLITTTPRGSRRSLKALEAAAPRAIENLWKHPFGADVVVQTPTLSFQVHRSTLLADSGWFRDKLPPPNLDGSPVVVRMSHEALAVGHCLRYMYTRRIELCERDNEDVWNVKNLPRCVLAYCAASSLRMSKMAAHLLRIVEITASNLAESATRHLTQDLTDQEVMMFSFHVYNALDIMYRGDPKKHMMPMRIAMAGVAHATFLWLMCRPVFLTYLTTQWSHLLPTLVLDQAEYRRSSGINIQPSKSSLPTEAELEKLFKDASDSA
ncbi:Fc.00g066880.m01.CDS01 [Cosmosporella sp. VM-42]